MRKTRVRNLAGAAYFPYDFPIHFGPFEDWAVTKKTDPARAGYCRAGLFRAGIMIPIFEKMIDRLKKIGQATSVVWRERVQGDPDPETGQPSITWEDQDIDAIIVSPQSARSVGLPVGMLREDVLQLVMVEPVKALDRIVFPADGTLDAFGLVDLKEQYVIQSTQEVFHDNSFLYRFCSVNKIPINPS